jgi:hypothetical protein
MIGGMRVDPGMVIGCIIPGPPCHGVPPSIAPAFCQLPATGIIIIVAIRISKVTSGKRGEHGLSAYGWGTYPDMVAPVGAA